MKRSFAAHATGRSRRRMPAAIVLGLVLAGLVGLAVSMTRGAAVGPSPSNSDRSPATSPSTSPNVTASDPAQTAAVASFVADTPWLARQVDTWVVGRAGTVTTRLPASLPGSTARVDWKTIVIAANDPGQGWRFRTGAGDGKDVVEVFSRPGDPAELQATVDPIRLTLYYSVGTGTGTDGGVYAVDLKTGTETALIPSGPAPDPSSRIRLEWSSSGTVLASSLCSVETCAIDVIDVRARTARRLDSTMALTAISDGFALGTDATHGGWQTVDLESGRAAPLAAELIADGHEGWALPDGRFVISGWTADRTAYVVAVAAHGEPVVALLTQAAPGARLLQRMGISGRFAVLGETPDEALDTGGADLDVLDLETGTVHPRVMPIRP